MGGNCKADSVYGRNDQENNFKRGFQQRTAGNPGDEC